MPAYKRDVLASAKVPRHYNARFVSWPDFRGSLSGYLRDAQKGTNYAIQINRHPAAFLTKAFGEAAANREISESALASELRHLITEVEQKGTVISIKMPNGSSVALMPVPTV